MTARGSSPTHDGAISCPNCGAWMYQTTSGWHCSEGCVKVTTYPDSPGETHYVQICTCGQVCPMHPYAVDLPSLLREKLEAAKEDAYRIAWLEKMQADVQRHGGGWVVRVFDNEAMEYKYDGRGSVDAGLAPFTNWREAVDEAITACYAESLRAEPPR